ncbi:MAG: dihydroorotase [Saprospiraceae bacterium]|nr:dihydroorotase [Saprospiraceae bacterium]
MNPLLIRKAVLTDPRHPDSGKTFDILIRNGHIDRMAPKLDPDTDTQVIEADGALVSPGWIDLGVQTGDPGFEHREDLMSATNAAAAGGFTAIGCFPNTHPVIHSKSQVHYLKEAAKNKLVDCYAIGAVSQDCEGKDITEMHDMFEAGAIAFSDGKKPLQHNGLMLRALQYVKAFDGVVMNQPLDNGLAGGGQMHEGIISTSLGLRGISSTAEELMVQRDLFLAEYTGSKLHLTNISTARSVDMVRQAKQRGLAVSASVAVMNLIFDDGALADFDSNFKVMPPLRSQRDIEALLEGLHDGTIDAISANHVPLDEESKKLEFPYAGFGAIGLQTAYAALNTHLREKISANLWVEKIAIRPRGILGLAVPELKEGAVANLTIFDPRKSWTFTEKSNHSKSTNSPFLGAALQGKIVATINRDLFFHQL